MDVIAYLADKGYGTPDHIMDTYTADEIVEFYERSSRLYAKELMDELIVGRHAQHADEKAMKKFMKDLTSRSTGKDGFMSADEVAAQFRQFMDK